MEQLRELVALLAVPQPVVQEQALEALLPYTPKSQAKTFLFKDNDMAGVRSIMALASTAQVERNALSALVNLADDKDVREHILGNLKFLTALVTRLEKSQTGHPALLSMLLANLSHSPDIVAIVGRPLAGLLAKFVEDLTVKYDYLAYVFAETARTTEGQAYWTGKDAAAIPLARLYPQILLTSEIRRSGVAATMKNAVFDLDSHERLVETGIIEYIMLALKGPEEMDEQDFATLPQLVKESAGADKKREDDESRQIVLLETLLILSSSTVGREALRKHNAYYVVRELHLASDDSDVRNVCERFVNMVMRGEPGQEPEAAHVVKKSKIEEVEEDDEITEVV